MTDIEAKRTKLRTWLAQSNMSRDELADKLGVSHASVNNWLSCTNIPDKRWEEIKTIFEPLEETAAPVYHAIAFAIPDDLNELVKQAAEKLGISVSEFVRRAALETTREILEKGKKEE